MVKDSKKELVHFDEVTFQLLHFRKNRRFEYSLEVSFARQIKPPKHSGLEERTQKVSIYAQNCEL